MNIRVILFVGFLIGAGFYSKKYFFLSEREVIHQKMDKLAYLLTKTEKENLINVANKVNQALEFFAPPVQVDFANPRVQPRVFTVESKPRIKELIASAKLKYPWLIVNFEDVDIQVQGSQAQARALARLKFKSSAQGLVYDLYHLETQWVKQEGWLIQEVKIEYVEPENN